MAKSDTDRSRLRRPLAWGVLATAGLTGLLLSACSSSPPPPRGRGQGEADHHDHHDDRAAARLPPHRGTGAGRQPSRSDPPWR